MFRKMVTLPAVCLAAAFFNVSAAGCSPPAGPVPLTGSVPAASGFRLETIVTGLEHPWSMVWLPDGSLLVTERPGRVRRIRDGTLDRSPLKGVPKIFAAGQGGLMEISLHPDFRSNSLVYLTYSAGSIEANRTVVMRAALRGDTLENQAVIYEVRPFKKGSEHFGSRISWLADHSFLLSIGDGGNPPAQLEGELSRHQAQKLTSPYGKILRLFDDGSPHPGNPFHAENNARAEIWTYGHRNVQGLTRDTQSGHVWASEHGSRGGDELNLILPGKNYGWPIVTYSREYFGPRISNETSRPGIEDPKVVWTPSIAPSGLAIYRGTPFPNWQGDAFIGGLVSKDVRRVSLSGTNAGAQESIPIGKRVRDVRQGPDGLLYILTDEANGALIRIVPEPR